MEELAKAKQLGLSKSYTTEALDRIVFDGLTRKN